MRRCLTAVAVALALRLARTRTIDSTAVRAIHPAFRLCWAMGTSMECSARFGAGLLLSTDQRVSGMRRVRLQPLPRFLRPAQTMCCCRYTSALISKVTPPTVPIQRRMKRIYCFRSRRHPLEVATLRPQSAVPIFNFRRQVRAGIKASLRRPHTRM
jgi:hypothetical protein